MLNSSMHVLIQVIQSFNNPPWKKCFITSGRCNRETWQHGTRFSRSQRVENPSTQEKIEHT